MNALRCRLAITTLSLLLWIAPFANAGTLALTTTSSNGDPLQVAQFNPALGQLTGVDLFYSGAMSVNVGLNVAAVGSSMGMYQIQFAPVISLTGPSPINLSITTSGVESVFDIVYPDSPASASRTFNLSGSCSGLLKCGSAQDPFFRGNLAPFIGSGYYPVSPIAGFNGLFVFNDPRGLVTSVAPAITASSLTVYYDYNPIPEPASYAALIAAGLAVLFGIRRAAAGR